MTTWEQRNTTIVKELLDGVPDAEVHRLCIAALRNWRRTHPNDGHFAMHGALGLELVPLLLANKGRTPVDSETLNALKEPFITDQNQSWFIGVSDFLAGFVRAGLGEVISRDKHNAVDVRLTRLGMSFLDNTERLSFGDLAIAGAQRIESFEAPEDERFEVPGYEILDALPAGASGEVFRARENSDSGIERVVKIFVPHPFADEQDPEPRFRSEVQALYRLQHRAVVRYISSGVLTVPRRAFYLIMELVSGARLSTACRSMPFDVRVGTMIEVLGGLHHAHQTKIFHRDIKPSNIMIRDSDGQAVLVDFGLAYLVGDERDDDRTRHVLGTPGYIPPEAINHPKRSRDPRHDVFQAGVTLYEILAGHLPRESYLSVESVDPRLAALDPILLRAMSPMPESRYQTAAEFSQALTEWLQQDASARVAQASTPEELSGRPSFARALELQTRQLRVEKTEQQQRREQVASAIRVLAPLYQDVRSRLTAIAQAAREQGLPVSVAYVINDHPIHVSLSALKEHSDSVTLFECRATPAMGIPFSIRMYCEYRSLTSEAWPLRFLLQIEPGPEYSDNDVVHSMDGSPHADWLRKPTSNDHFPRLLQCWLDEPAHWAAFDVV